MGLEKLRQDVADMCVEGVFNVVLEDFTLQLDLEIEGTCRQVTLLMPEEYPRGEATNMDDFSLLRPGRVADVVQRLRDEYINNLCAPSSGSQLTEAESDDDPGSMLGPEHPADELQRLQPDIEHFRKVHGDNISVEHYGTMVSIRLALPLHYLGQFQAEAMHLCKEKRLVLDYEWPMAHLDAVDMPVLRRVYATASADLNCKEHGARDESFGVVRWYLQDRLNTAMRLNWLLRHAARLEATEAGGCDPDGFGVDCEGEDSAMVCAAPVNQVTVQEAEEKREAEWFSLCKQATRRCPAAAAGGAPAGPSFNAASSLAFTAKYENFFEDGNVNILNGVYRYLKARMLTVCMNCVICDKKLGYSCVKPAVCNGATCEFAMENFGLGCNPAADILHSPELVDLLVSFAARSIESSLASQQRDSFAPWCENIELGPERLAEIAAKFTPGAPPPTRAISFKLPDGSKNLALCKEAVQKIPPVETLREGLAAVARGSAEGGQLLNAALVDMLNAAHPLSYPLLRWILSSNRSHLMRLPKRHLLPGLGDHQYVLCSSSPEKEKIFRARRAKMRKKHGGSGSFWGWHGSPSGNWHAILRLGLRNYSNTHMMSSGAVHGAGIYLAGDLSTALGYKGGPMAGWNNSKAYCRFTALALCEIVDERREENSGVRDCGRIYVVRDEALVSTRFLFLSPNKPEDELSADGIPKPKEILALFE
eukprot:gene14075-21544_t